MLFGWFDGIFSSDETNAGGSDTGAAPPSETWGQWFGGKLTGAFSWFGLTVGGTLASIIKPLFPFLLVAVIVYVFARIMAEKVVP